MTIARKLWLGFGVLILISVVAYLVIFLRERSIGRALNEIVEVEEPTRAATFEMEINSAEMSRDILDYLDSGDPAYRERFADDKADLERFAAQYERLVDTPKSHDQVERIDSVYGRYATLGGELMDAKDDQDAATGRVNVSLVEIDEIFDNHLQAGAPGGGPEGAEKARLAAGMEADVAEVGTYVNNYLREPEDEYRALALESADDFREELARFEELDLTEEERDEAEELGNAFEELAGQSRDAFAAADSIAQREAEFVGLQEELDDVFDEDVQPWTERQLEEAEGAAAEAIRGVYATIIGLLLTGLLTGILAAYLINRGIVGSVRTLREGADRIGRGDLGHRIELQTNDELGTVASAFNGMLDRRREADEALKASEEQYRRLVETVQEGIGFVDARERITYCNPAYAEIFGLTPEELVGRSLFEFLDEEQRRVALEQTAARREGVRSSYEISIKTADGETKCLSALGTPITDAAGNFRGAVHAIIDVTERARAEQALRESEERFRGLSDATFEGVVIVDGGEILETNRSFAEMFGYEPSEVYGMSVTDFAAPESREAVRRNISSGAEAPYEAVGLRKDGTTFDAEVRGRVSLYQGSAVRVTAVRDITEGKRAEEELRRSEARTRAIV